MKILVKFFFNRSTMITPVILINIPNLRRSGVASVIVREYKAVNPKILDYGDKDNSPLNAKIVQLQQKVMSAQSEISWLLEENRNLTREVKEFEWENEGLLGDVSSL